MPRDQLCGSVSSKSRAPAFLARHAYKVPVMLAAPACRCSEHRKRNDFQWFSQISRGPPQTHMTYTRTIVNNAYELSAVNKHSYMGTGINGRFPSSPQDQLSLASVSVPVSTLVPAVFVFSFARRRRKAQPPAFRRGKPDPRAPMCWLY